MSSDSRDGTRGRKRPVPGAAAAVEEALDLSQDVGTRLRQDAGDEVDIVRRPVVRDRGHGVKRGLRVPAGLAAAAWQPRT